MFPICKKIIKFELLGCHPHHWNSSGDKKSGPSILSSSNDFWRLASGKNKTFLNWASSHGLVVKAEDSWPRGPGFKPPLWRPLFRHHSFGSKLGTKIVETLTWHCCMCCNPTNGRVDFEEWSAYKIQLHGIE
jgi:hypothetical protein